MCPPRRNSVWRPALTASPFPTIPGANQLPTLLLALLPARNSGTFPTEPVSIETPVPTPEASPTPELAQAVCPADRDRAGQTLSYDPAEISETEAVETECGTLAPVWGVCPEDRQGRGLPYQYDPDETTEDQAVEEKCGMTKEQILDGCEPLDETTRERILKGPRRIVGTATSSSS